MKTKSLMALFILTLAPHLCSAASYQGTIVSVSPFNGQVYIVVTGGGFDGGSSTCLNSPTLMIYAVDPSTPFGRTLVAVALSAKLSGRLVYAIGNGTCTGGNPYNGGNAEVLIGMDLKG